MAARSVSMVKENRRRWHECGLPARASNAFFSIRACAVRLSTFAMSKQTVSDYTWTYTEQPHRSRRKEILAKHPEVKNLFGFCPRQKYWVTLSVVAQIFFAYLLRDQSWWLIIPLAYVVGGTINHSLFLAFHELAHNLFFDRPVHNTLFGFFANLPMTLAITVYVQFASATRLRAPLTLAVPFFLRRAP